MVQLALLRVVRFLLIVISASTFSLLRLSRFVAGALFHHLNACLKSFSHTIKYSANMIGYAPLADAESDDSGNPAAQQLNALEHAAASQHVTEREMCLRELVKTLRMVDQAEDKSLVERFFKIIYDLGEDDSYNVRCGLLEQMTMLYCECQQSGKMLPFIDQCLTPFITNQLNAVETVRKNAVGTIGILLEQGLLSQESLKSLIIPTLFLLLEDDTPEQGYASDEQRMETCAVICRVISFSSIADKKWLFDNFIPKYSHFLNDHVFHIRKAAVSVFGELAKMFGEKFNEKFIVPHLLVLSEDSVWGVRKTICEVFVDVASYCSESLRRKHLAPRFIQLLHDQSRWVSYVAYQELGPFIATFANGTLTGLSLCNGRVVERDASDSGYQERTSCDPEEDNFEDIPPCSYIAHSSTTNEEHESFKLISPNGSNSGSRLLFELTDMLDQWQKGSHAASSSSAAASGRCSSTDDLTRFGLSEGEMYEDELEMDNEDSDDPLNCSVIERDLDSSADSNDSSNSSQNTSNDISSEDEPDVRSDRSESPIPNQFNFWATSISVDGYGEDLTYFGAASMKSDSVSKLKECDILTKRLDVLSTCEDKQAGETLNKSSQNSNHPDDECNSDSDVSKSNPEVMNNDVVDMDISVPDEQRSPHVDHLDGTQNEIMEMDIESGQDTTTPSSSEMNNTLALFANQLRDSDDISDERENLGDTMMLFQQRQKIVPQALVDAFVDMEAVSQTDSDINRHRAHNFPAVAFTMGRKNWNLLRDAYKVLATDSQWKVRTSLAASLHDMAAIIGPENTKEDLIPVFNTFKEDVEDVRQGLLGNLCEFYEQLDEESRLDMLNKLPHVLRIDHEANWRFRKEFIVQCGRLCNLYSVKDINHGLAGIALTLCTDKVAEVRREAAQLTARILGKMVEIEWPEQTEEVDISNLPITEAFVNDIVRGFARSRTSKRRQTFASICECCLVDRFIDKVQFATLLLDHLTLMANDKVPNVRLVVARVLEVAGKMPNEQSHVQVEESLTNLEADADMDVSRAARSARGMDADSEKIDIISRLIRIRDKENAFFEDLYSRQHDNESMDMSVSLDESNT